MDRLLEILHRNWGYENFRPCQREIMEDLLAGRDSFGLLPTGGGKSLTFQVPALVFEGITLVVTPLISLMKDQVDNLRQRKIKAVYFQSGMSPAEHQLAVDRCRLGKVKIAYISPERLGNKSFLIECGAWNVSAIVVDEAHCISQWGYDFRPSYLRIGNLRKLFPDAPVLALTASATPEVVNDIIAKLEMQNPKLHSLSFERGNISYIVRQSGDKNLDLLKALRGVKGTAVVYVRSRKKSVEVAKFLNANGIVAGYFHAGLPAEEKARVQDFWKSGRTPVIVATTAFGMGIDKADVRIVAHFDIPSSVEEYYQESGRAGRDGLPAYALVLTAPRDKAALARRVSTAFPAKDYVFRIYELVCSYLNVAVGTGQDKVFEFDFRKFVEIFHLSEASVKSALALLTRAGWFEFDDASSARARVMVTVDKHELYLFSLDKTSDDVLHGVLRACEGVFADYVALDEHKLQKITGLNAEQIYESLLKLRKLRIIDFIPRRNTPSIYFPQDREETKRLYLPREVYEEQKKRMIKRIDAMKSFAFAFSDECRNRKILEYFGEKSGKDCGRCDLCRARNPKKISPKTRGH